MYPEMDKIRGLDGTKSGAESNMTALHPPRFNPWSVSRDSIPYLPAVQRVCFCPLPAI